MKYHGVAMAGAVVVLVGVTGCGGGGATINGKAVPTDPKAVCKIFADQSKSESSDNSFTEKDYQEFLSWADHVKDDAMSKDLRALATLIKQMPSDNASSSTDSSSSNSMGLALSMLSTYESLTGDCAKYGVKLPNLLDDGSADSDSPSASPSDEPPIAFGQTKTYDDGLSVSVGAPVEFKPSAYASAGKAPVYVKFEVTLHNGTGKTFDPSSFSASLQSGSTDEDEVYDSGKGIGNTPDTKLLDGRDAVFWIGFGAESTTDLVLDLSLDFDRDVIFASAP
jgi:hypothetical protein